MTIHLTSGYVGESVTARRVPVDVILDLVAELPDAITIHLRPDDTELDRIACDPADPLYAFVCNRVWEQYWYPKGA